MKVVRQARLELNGGSTPDLLRPPIISITDMCLKLISVWQVQYMSRGWKLSGDEHQRAPSQPRPMTGPGGGGQGVAWDCPHPQNRDDTVNSDFSADSDLQLIMCVCFSETWKECHNAGRD